MEKASVHNQRDRTALYETRRASTTSFFLSNGWESALTARPQYGDSYVDAAGNKRWIYIKAENIRQTFSFLTQFAKRIDNKAVKSFVMNMFL